MSTGADPFASSSRPVNPQGAHGPGVRVPGARVPGAQIPGTVVAEEPHRSGGPQRQQPTPPAPTADAAQAVAEAPADARSTEQTSPAKAPEKTPEKASAEKSKRSAGMASGGRPVEVPDFNTPTPHWPGPVNEDEVYVPDQEFDASDLHEVNRQMNRARARLFRCSQQLKGAQRMHADADLAYSRAMRRQLVSLSGGTEASRRALAEIMCEHLENDVIVARQVVEEWKKRSMDARDDLKALENLSHNVRAQMDVR